MIRSFFDRRRQYFVDWWHAPITQKDRALGALVGGLGSFWIGVLGRILLGPLPVSLSTIGWWALGSVVVGVMLGIIFPKVTTCVCFPFSVFGGGSGTY
jgi:hypothetical protein